MTRPFELHATEATTSLLAPSQPEIAGLLRLAARDLARLEHVPPQPGNASHLAAASRAVREALEELEASE